MDQATIENTMAEAHAADGGLVSTQTLFTRAVEPLKHIPGLAMFVLRLSDFNEQRMPGVEHPFMVSYPDTGHPWWHYYANSGLQQMDPVMKFVSLQRKTVCWSSVRSKMATPAEKQFWKSVASFGLHQGITGNVEHPSGPLLWSVAGENYLEETPENSAETTAYLNNLSVRLADHDLEIRKARNAETKRSADIIPLMPRKR